MLHDEYIEYLKRENKSKYEEYKNYYIKRNLKRFIQIDRKIIDDKVNEFLIVHSEKEFKEKCSKKKSVHFLEPKSDSSNFEWKKSKGPISDLNKYLIKQEEVCIFVKERKISSHMENILIISAEPGMGKSTILDKLVSKSNSKMFYLKIVLNNLKKTLSHLKKQKIKYNDDDVLEFILRNLLKKENLEISVLNKLAQEKRLILMFDGLDEVNDYTKEVKRLIKTLSVKNELMKIFLSTRNHLREELEDYFETISFNLNNFEENDQIKFVYNYWRSLNRKQKMNLRHSDLEHSAQFLIKKVRSSLNQRISDLIGIPLQTKMIADIFFDKLGSNDSFETEVIGSIADLYKKFVEKKIVIGYEEKKRHSIIDDLGLFEIVEKNFYEDHKNLSTKYFFKKTEFEIQMKKVDIQAYGLIVDFRDETPIFLHQSFAEYFLALNAVEKIKQRRSLKDILRNREFFLVRNFLDDIFPKEMIKESKEKKRSLKEEIENCCKENLPNIIEYLIVTKNADLNKENEFLLMVSKGGHKEIAQLLIEKGIDINQTNSILGQNALHFASGEGHTDVVRLLIEKGIDINQRDEDGWNALHLVSYYRFNEIVQLLIEKGIDINQTDEDGQNALHLASREGKTEVVKLLIEKGIDINQKDKDGQNALHLASYEGHIDIVELLIENGLDINQIDEEGQNALHLASWKGHKEIVQLLIQQEGIDFNQKERFFNKNALDFAFENGHEEIIELLKEKGLELSLTSSSKNGPLMMPEGNVDSYGEKFYS